MTNLKSGDSCICINAEGVEEYGVTLGGRYPVNIVNIIPGQGEFVGILVCEGKEEETGCRVIVLEASRFEKAYTVTYRIWLKSGDYILLDNSFNEEDHQEKEDPYVDITITLPESKLQDIDQVLSKATNDIIASRKQVEEDDAEDTTEDNTSN